MNRTFTDKTNAIDKSIGFDFQFFYFLDAILNMKVGESVGIEVKDDVHTELNSDKQILIQLKHTTQKAANGFPITLSELDIDLWKTISNWAKVICDASDGRKDIDKQIEFVQKTTFLLASNKSENGGNSFVDALNAYHLDNSKYTNVVDKLTFLKSKTDNQTIKDYLNSIRSLNEEVLKIFLLHIKFELNEDDIIDRIKKSILNKVIAAHRVDEVFTKLHSNLHKDNYLATKAGYAITISFKDFITKYSKIFDDARATKLVRHKFSFVPPANLTDQTFIRQLLEIGDFADKDTDAIIRYTTEKVMLENHLTKWVADGLLTTDDVDHMYDETQSIWHSRFRQAYRFADAMSANEKKTQALAMIDELRRSALSVDMNPLETRLSNGVFYYLSDLPTIGWDHEWESKFK